ncbi:MAG: ParA family protein [Rhodospirillaceae bacterium]|jgi:chromosome partitioning protein|nr:ParA family protein [Rhodospirillaceae bacterium]MBT5666349.1 ParA family protein [Rhodospirillaceae bacterium]MBT5811084.1 ParA family protein [Rhodospirillaceae bacterium]
MAFQIPESGDAVEDLTKTLGASGGDPRILAVANQKGGVGKTTTAVNLATALAAIRKKVLIIDLDPQGNASTGLGVERAMRKETTYSLLVGDARIAEAIVPTMVPGLSVVPSSVDLSGAELELIDVPRREFRLKSALADVSGDFDYILIDCPPALGLLTLNAFCAAHAVLVPLQCEFYALEGLSHLVKTVDRIKRAFNPALEIQGVVLTMYDRRNNLSDMVAADVRDHFGDKVYQTVIPRNVRVSEAPSFGKPVLLYDWRCAGSQAYIHLAGEVLKQERSLNLERRLSA